MAKKRFRQSRLNSLGGTSVVLLLLLVIFVGALFFVGGVIPRTTHTNPGGDPYTPVTTIAPDTYDNLQLKTIKFKACTSNSAIGFLLDQSGSMQYGLKESSLKNAINVFAGNFPNEGVMGLRTYSDNTYRPIVVNFDYFKNNKTQIFNAVKSMTWWGATHSKTAFQDMKRDLDFAKTKFPNHKFNLVFISDGIPESEAERNRLCPSGNLADPTTDRNYCGPRPSPDETKCRCFAPAEDPTSVADQIKASGVRIFSIVYLYDVDKEFQGRLSTLMKNVSSDPTTDYFEAPIGPDAIKPILEQISSKICEDV